MCDVIYHPKIFLNEKKQTNKGDSKKILSVLAIVMFCFKEYVM